MTMMLSDQMKSLLQGAVDMHVHSAPDLVERKLNDFELARAARDVGFSAVVIKNHWGDTAPRAVLTSLVTEGIRVVGSIALNASVGGLNPAAVEVSLKLGGKVVWMPTVDAANHRGHMGQEGGIRVTDEGGKVRSEVWEILALVKESDAVVASGHVSLDETFALVKAARETGVRKIVITHPEFWVTFMPGEVQEQLAAYGVIFERCYYASTLQGAQLTSFETTVDWIRKIGHESTVIASDLGQLQNPYPVEGFVTMLRTLREAGFTGEQIETMIKRNPGHLLSD